MKRNKNFSPRIQAYLKALSIFCKPSTVNFYDANIHHFLRHLETLFQTNSLSKKHIGSLTREQLQHYLFLLCERKLSPNTKLSYLISIRKYLRWEIEEGTLNQEILKVLDPSRLPRRPDYLPRSLSPENDRFLIRRLSESTSPYAPLFLLLRQTGLRIGELVQLPWDPVVTVTPQEKYLKVPLGKTNNERLVPLSAESLLLIEKIHSLFPIYKKKPDLHRLIGIKGTPLSVCRHLARQFEKLRRGITDQGKPVTFHRLRHTYATTLLTGGVSLASLMKLLGHRKLEMTLRYTKITPSYLREEYLKALTVLQQQSGVLQSNPTSTLEIHPAQALDSLISFITKAASLNHSQQKNLLLRLRRLQTDLLQINFSQKIKPIY